MGMPYALASWSSRRIDAGSVLPRPPVTLQAGTRAVVSCRAWRDASAASWLSGEARGEPTTLVVPRLRTVQPCAQEAWGHRALPLARLPMAGSGDVRLAVRAGAPLA